LSSSSGTWAPTLGIIIITACGSDRPDITSSSRTLSKMAESLPASLMTGRNFSMSSPNSGEERFASRARIRLMFPRRRVDLPLWAAMRNGCARCQVGSVFVLYRWWTTAYGS